VLFEAVVVPAFRTVAALADIAVELGKQRDHPPDVPAVNIPPHVMGGLW
jgi:hypothetical protein